ncbi:hypothetical protein IKF23_01030 [Candidatus Saccharibacteria bacterium]|nr:hypothetical protein [Candidatus Saccharibacteria bacterium]
MNKRAKNIILPTLITIISMISANTRTKMIKAQDLPTTVNIKPSLSITIPSNIVNLNLDPSNNNFGSNSTTITVATNNPNGYKLYLSSNTTNLTNTTDSTYTIPTLASSTSEANFPANYWGYKLNSDTTTNYLPYQSDTLVSESTTATNGISSTATFAAKVDYNKPAGLYSIAFDLKTIPIITQVYMQDMTAEQCTETPTIVIDKRDEQAYAIQRLPDGRCWMLDNLNLDLTNMTIVSGLSSENTNADEVSLKSLRQGNRTDCGEDGCNQYATSGLRLENWTSSSSTSMPLVNKGGICDSNIQGTYPSKCADEYQDTSFNNNDVIPINNIGFGDYKIGIFYNYCAASAGSYCYDGNFATSSDENIESDICSSSWHIPSISEFFNLFNTISAKYPQTSQDMSSPYSFQSILSTPLAGFYGFGTAWWMGRSTDFWPSSIQMDNLNRITILSVSQTGIRESLQYRDRGNSVRCVLNEQ